ncbi:TPA: P-loop NTPase fold protein [Serratia liquefaciens]
MDTINKIIQDSQKLLLSSANEAETRLKVIDQILFEILKWTKDDVSIETRVSEDGKTTFADYLIKTASTAFIIEAKKIGETFKTKQFDRRLKLNNNNLEGAFGDAIIQARDYCRKLSIQFAVVTNGEQWIIFPANRTDQVSFNSSYAIVFNGLQSALKDDYTEFYDLLSRKAVINSSLEVTLLGNREDQIEERRLKNTIRKSISYDAKNPIYPLVEEAIITSFSDTITEIDPSLFERCYVNTPDRMKFDRRVNMHISKSQHLFNTAPARPMQKRDVNAFKDSLLRAKRNSKPLAIVILGTVGAGKTTFLHYTRNISASEFFEKSSERPYPHWIKVDFLQYTNDISPVDYIYNTIKSYIINDDFFGNYELCIQNAYKDEISSIKKGPAFLIAKDEEKINQLITDKLSSDYENVKPYADKLISYATKNTSVFLVIDNVDQLNEEAQSQIFTDCVAFSQRLKCNLVISLRNSTYVEHRNSPAFNAFDFDPILIEPPKVEAVLSKRFFLAKNMLEGEEGDFESDNGIRFHVDNKADLISLLQSSVLGTEIGNLLEVLAAGDIRNALRMTREFIEHGYTNPGKAIRVYKERGAYTLPKHEALRAILLGNQAVYSEAYSLVGNPFDSRQGKTNFQLLRLFVLAALVQHSADPAFQYIDGVDIRKNLRKIGVGDDDTLTVLRDLCTLRFISTAGHDTPEFKSSFYPTRLGGYIAKELISNFMFIECTMMDTFISDESVWEKLKNFERLIMNSSNDVIKRLGYRIERANMFFEYMQKLYDLLFEEANKRALPKEWRTNPLKEAHYTFSDNLEKALQSAQRNYGTK